MATTTVPPTTATTTKADHGYERDEKIAESSSIDIHTDVDDPHAGLEFPTEEERLTLRRVSDTIPWNAYRMFNLYLQYTYH